MPKLKFLDRFIKQEVGKFTGNVEEQSPCSTHGPRNFRRAPVKHTSRQSLRETRFPALSTFRSSKLLAKSFESRRADDFEAVVSYFQTRFRRYSRLDVRREYFRTR